MACALEADPINQLEENLQCSVCLETLKDPRTLPCFHSFCKDCLEGVVKTCRDKAPRDQPAIREFHCPNCRTKFTLDPDKHVADMPRNHFICNMVQATAILDRGTRIPCSHNCNQGFSVARCVTCEKFLCRDCLTGHNNYRGHKSHSVLSMEELSKPENRKKIQGKMYCNEHSGETLKVYCETCDELICKDCMDFIHLKQNHSCLLVKDVANNYKGLIASKNNAMENALKEGTAFLEGLSLTTRRLDKDTENAKRKMMQNKDAVLKNVSEMLDNKAEMLSKQMEQIHKSERARLDGQTEATKRYVDNIKQSVQLSRKLVEQGTEEEIISSQKMMLDSADNLLKTCPEFLNKPIRMRSNNCGNEEQQFKEEILRSLGNSLGWVKYERGRNPSENQPPTILLSYSEATAGKKTDPKPGTGAKTSKDDKCSICLCQFTNKKTLDKCGHSFCTECIQMAFEIRKQCPTCSVVYGPLTGNQPDGQMFDHYQSKSLPGFGLWSTIVISYRFPSGIQGPDHPNPGKSYQGTSRTAYLPNNKEGRKVLRLLKKAFDQKLTFTIGRSTTTGREDVVTWNDIHHKIAMLGGPTCFGYPDPKYLKRVQEELAAKGITE